MVLMYFLIELAIRNNEVYQYALHVQASMCYYKNFGPKNFGTANQNFHDLSDYFFKNLVPSKLDLWCQLDANTITDETITIKQ